MLSAWYTRNLAICARLLQAIKPGDRVVVFYGQGHIYLLQQCLLAQASCLTLLFSTSIERREVAEARLRDESSRLARTEAEKGTPAWKNGVAATRPPAPFAAAT